MPRNAFGNSTENDRTHGVRSGKSPKAGFRGTCAELYAGLGFQGTAVDRFAAIMVKVKQLYSLLAD